MDKGPFAFEFDATDLVNQLTSLQVSQWPMARVVATTRLAMDGRDALRDDIGNHFNTTNQFLKRAIRVRWATKDRPRALVYHEFEPLADHVTGATRKAVKRVRAIPTKQIKRTKTGKISTSKRPAAILKKPSVFIGKNSKGDPAIMQRVGKRIKVLYGLRPQVKIKKRWDFHGTVQKAIEKNQVRRLNEAIEQAVKTSGTKGKWR